MLKLAVTGVLLWCSIFVPTNGHPQGGDPNRPFPSGTGGQPQPGGPGGIGPSNFNSGGQGQGSQFGPGLSSGSSNQQFPSQPGSPQFSIPSNNPPPGTVTGADRASVGSPNSQQWGAGNNPNQQQPGWPSQPQPGWPNNQGAGGQPGLGQPWAGGPGQPPNAAGQPSWAGGPPNQFGGGPGGIGSGNPQQPNAQNPNQQQPLWNQPPSSQSSSTYPPVQGGRPPWAAAAMNTPLYSLLSLAMFLSFARFFA